MTSASRGAALLVASLGLVLPIAPVASAADGNAPKHEAAAANHKDSARAMAREALELMHAERWGEAHSLLTRAYALVPAPTIALLDGRALDQLGRLVEAAERYRVASSTSLTDDAPEPFRQAVADARVALENLEKRIPKLTVGLSGAPHDAARIQVSVDGQDIPRATLERARPVDPGDHVVRVTLDGRLALEDAILLKEGETKRVVMDLVLPEAQVSPAEEDSAPPSPPASRGRTVAAWTTFGIGAAALGAGITGGVIMLDAHRKLEAVCQPMCPTSASDDLSRFRTARTISAVGYVAGGVGLAAGAALLIFGKQPKDRPVSAWTSGPLVGLQGHF